MKSSTGRAGCPLGLLTISHSRTSPWLPCWANDYYLSSPFASISGDTLPHESKLQIQLGTNSSGVDNVTFSYTDPNGNVRIAACVRSRLQCIQS